ncbi:hypothetical protein NLI96_g509 [Meripilus lineatus]|uniref:Uncharacterized protein n=1 Tax=Meripilus lineatus TaxID=2056292 RepID=A0AAD5VDJ8_9APHY|nr:hypothetical protein NLI96_g509 [Physisporinus lineatus]
MSLQASPLNFDILANLFAFVDSRQDALSLMKTCRSLRAPATPRILSFPVYLYQREEITSFCDYMLTKSSPSPQNRCHYLRRLHVLGFLGNKNGLLAQNLAKIIQNSTGLEELVIRDIEDFLWSGGGVVFEALSDLKSHDALTRLELRHVSNEASRLLQAMNIKSLSELLLVFGYGSGDEPAPFKLLAGLGPNLTTLSLENAGPYSVGVQCPHVHTLDMMSCSLLPSRDLTRMFPNLVNLSFHNKFGPDDDEEIEERRVENQAGFEADGNPWPSLQRLSGTISHLYMFGFIFQVKFLELSTVSAKKSAMCLAMIDDLSPINLHLLIDVATFSLSELEMFLTRAFGGLTQCTYLSLSFEMDGISLDLSDFEPMLVSVLERLKVHLLEIRIPPVYRRWTMEELCDDDDDDDDEDDDDLTRNPFDPLDDYLCAIDTKALITTIAERIPSLHHAGLWIGNQSRTGGYWEIVRIPGGENKEQVASGTISLTRVCDFNGRRRTLYGIPEIGELGNKN